jgi:hypothetical protein
MLARKSRGAPALLSCRGHLLTENRDRFVRLRLQNASL